MGKRQGAGGFVAGFAGIAPWAFALSLASGAAAGCSDDGAKGVNADTAPVTLTFWRHDNSSYQKANDDAFAAYKLAHPNVTVKPFQVPWQAYTAALNAELKLNLFPHDFVLMPPAQLCTFADNLADVPEDVVPLSEARNTFFAPPLSAVTCAGVLKGLPVEYNLEYGGVIVNVDLYHARFPGKEPGWATWDAFIDDAALLAEVDATGKPCVNGLDIDPDWPEPARHILLSQILQRGGNYWNGDLFNFDTPEARASLTTMVSWVTVNRVMFPSLIPDRNTFVTKRLAHGATGYGCTDDVAKPLSVMGYAGTWAMPDILALVPAGGTTNYQFVPLPPMIGTEHKFVQNAGFAFAVPKTSKNPKVAWDIIKSIALSPEGMRKWAMTAGTLPALKANGTPAAALNDPVLAKVQPLLGQGQWMGYIPAGSTADVLGAMVSNYFAAVKGTKTIEVALKDMQDTANAAIIQYR